jgi:hypothetical protein
MTPSIELFNELRAEMERSSVPSRHGNDLNTKLVNSSGTVHIFQELDGRMGIFIPLGSDDPQYIQPDIRSQYITLRTVTRKGQEIVQLRLENPALENVFHVFVDTFFKAFRNDRERAGTIAQAQLRRWRSLFTPVPPNSLSDAEEVGLLCELQEMQTLLATDGAQAFYRWTGPDQQAHDFRLEDRGVECKATRISNGLHVTINGARQLLPEPQRRLLLSVRKYESTPNGEITLSGVVRQLLDEDLIPQDELLGQLEEMRFSLAGVDPRNENRYRLVGCYVFEVGEGFPRLTLDGTEERISAVRYGLDLTDPENIPGYRKDGSLN